LEKIFTKFEDLVGKKTLYSIMEDEEDNPPETTKKGHLFDNVNKIN